jgi:hypothetical protein
MFRNPFDSWTNSLPKPKKFGMPNQIPSPQNRMMSQSNPWRQEIFDDTMTNPTAPPTQTPEQPRNEWEGYLSEMKDLYTRQGPSVQAYEEHMKNIPQYQKPGGWHRFGSALVGAATGLQQGAGAGFAAGQEALNLPHRRAMEEWSTKEKGLGRQAELEEKATGGKLKYMSEVRALAKDQKDYERLMAKQKLDERAQDSLDEYRKEQIAELKTRGWTTHVDDRGHRISYNPKTGESKDFGPDIAKTNTELDRRRIADSERRTGIQGYSAQTGRMNYELGSRTQDRLERGENPHISAIEQSTARGSALVQARAENTKWDYLTPEGQIDPNKIPTEGTPERQQFDRFMGRVKELEQGIFNRRRPAPIYDYDPDEE